MSTHLGPVVHTSENAVSDRPFAMKDGVKYCIEEIWGRRIPITQREIDQGCADYVKDLQRVAEETGDAEKLKELAFCYLEGNGVEVNEKLSLKFFELAEAQSH